MTKQYKIYSFPSYGGIPWETNSWFVSLLMMSLRKILSGGIHEIRRINTATEEHTVW